MHLNNLIRHRRIELGISQAKLAKMLGYSSAQFISNIENGRSNIPKKKLKRLRRGLLIDVNRLIGAMMDDRNDEICKALGIKP